MKKIIVVLAILFSIHSFGQTVGQTFTANGINYRVTRATLPYEVVVGDNRGFVGAANIPASVTYAGNSFAVTSISIAAFYASRELYIITIPNSVTSIGNGAFVGTGLTSVTVNWTTPIVIDAIVFDARDISGVTLYVPAGTAASYDAAAVWTDFNPIAEPDAAPFVRQIFAVNGINYIVTKATLPYEVAVYRNAGFVGVATIPTTVSNAGNSFAVTSIGNRAFDQCRGLTSISIPNAVTSIGDNAFYQCYNLKSVSIPNSVTGIGASAFSYCGLTSVTIGNSVQYIGEDAFFACSGLTTVTIPNSVTSISRRAFSYTGLISITVNWQTPITINSNVFYMNLSAISLNVPQGTEMAYNNALVWKDFYNISGPVAGTVQVGQTFAANGINYFVRKATLPYEVAVYRNAGFDGVATIPTTVSNAGNSFEVTNIGNRAFSLCPGLTSVSIPNSVTSIGDNAFEGCRGLTSFSIPNSVTSIGENAFTNCRGLTSVSIPNSLTSIASGAFSNCTGLTSITIPNSVTSIGNSAFSYCTGLTLVSIPNSVTSIDSAAFSDCRGLTSITIPNSVTSIGGFAFGFCTGLTSVSIGNSVTSIGFLAFRNTGLTSVTIPNSVTSIDFGAFSNCEALTSVNIPNSVTSIGNGAFANCKSLALLTVNWATPLVINPNAEVFGGVNKRAIGLIVPAGSEALYEAAAVWKDFIIGSAYLGFCKGAKISDAVGTSSLKFYTALTGGALLAGTTALSTKKIYTTQTVNGIESSPRVSIVIIVNKLPTTPGAMTTSDPILCKYIGTNNEVTYAVPAVAGTTYNWSTPAGVNVIADASATDNSITVNFLNTALNDTSVGGVGTISVSAVNSFGCPSAPRSLALTSKLPTAPASLTLTSADTALDFNVAGVPSSLSSLTIITKVGPYMGTSTVFTLTAATAPTADHYRWELPAGINSFGTTTTPEGVISTSPIITVNFANVDPGTEPLVIKVYSVGGCGESTARILNLTRVLPTAPTKLTLADAGIALTKVGSYTGKTTPLTLTATRVVVQGATATSYSWVLPSGVNVVSGATPVADNGTTKTYSGTATVLTINLGGITTGVLSIPMSIFAVNGTGTSATARKLTVTSAAPATPAITTTSTTFTTCATSTYTATAIVGATYNWTVPPGALIVGKSTGNVIVVNFESVTTATSYAVTCSATNGTGTSAVRRLAQRRKALCSKIASDEVIADDFSVIAYPNPSSSEFTLEVQSSSKGATGVQVYDVTGRLIENLQSNSNSVQVGRNYPSGVYNVIVNQGTKVKTLRVIKR